MAALDHRKWVDTARIVTIETFAVNFSYTDSRPAYQAFLCAVKNSRLKDHTKTTVIERFNAWKTNKSGASMFWFQQRQSMSIKKGKSVATIGLVDAARNELPMAIQNEAVSREECGLPTPPEKKRSAHYQLRSNLNKKTRGANEVGDDDGESEDFEGEMSHDEYDYEIDDDGTGLQDEENLSDVFRELRDVEKDTEPGFYPLIRALYHAARREKFQLPDPKPELSTQQSFLWDFVYTRLDTFGTMTPAEQKDVFVAVSGIVDLELHSSFPQRTELVQKCRAGVSFTFPPVRDQMRLYQVYVDVQDDAEEARLEDLKRQLRTDMSRFEEGSTKMMVAEILMILVKRCVPDKFGRAKRTESSTLFVWYAVWEVLFASTSVEVEVGETVLREAQTDQVAVRTIVGPKAAAGRAGASGRKLDFRLIATIKTGQRFEPFTLCNDEHKGLGSSDSIADIQRKKNMRLNKSIIMNGRVPMNSGTIYQDVIGLEGTWNILYPFEDVMLCCGTNEPPLHLPSNEFELGSFLLDDGMERLLAYREHILSLARKVQGLVSNPRRPSTSRCTQVPANSPGTSVHAQAPSHSLANTQGVWRSTKGHGENFEGVTAPLAGSVMTGAKSMDTGAAESISTSSNLRPGTPPRASYHWTHPPTFYTPTKPK
ncbi:hypothetical protein EMPS_00103 [Entomortierella parvispora]|uniref:Uncharacterized protein n=1 Tax=Entomortierella parvispora TaxID=205924 RepID=A0A9P3H129_9FUNG|nr:hypothetical protein EMPS_00103 [Entomortierella parvispora]